MHAQTTRRRPLLIWWLTWVGVSAFAAAGFALAAAGVAPPETVGVALASEFSGITGRTAYVKPPRTNSLRAKSALSHVRSTQRTKTVRMNPIFIFRVYTPVKPIPYFYIMIGENVKPSFNRRPVLAAPHRIAEPERAAFVVA